MKNAIAAMGAAAVLASAAQGAATVGVDDSSAPWIGFMNVFELDGSTFVFGSPWGLPDLNSSFDDGAPSVTMSPNTINDPDPFWYIGGGGPGAAGNKVMEANLFQEQTGGALNGMTVTFEGYVTSNTLTAAHDATIFIRDFAGDFSSFEETRIDATEGFFSISLDTINDPTRVVQWGFQVKGVNVWSTDVAPFGDVTFSSVPTPASAALLGLGGLVATRRRR